MNQPRDSLVPARPARPASPVPASTDAASPRPTNPEPANRVTETWRDGMADLLGPAELPPGFAYPPEFRRVVELGLVNLEPWWIFDGTPLRDRVDGLRQRFPDRVLVPFARREDNDDVACWEHEPRRVVVIHDFASPGFENRAEFADFYGWLRQAVEDLIAFA